MVLPPAGWAWLDQRCLCRWAAGGRGLDADTLIGLNSALSEEISLMSDQDQPADVTSDPAKDDQVGGDWSDEGGATVTGPATDVGEEDSSFDGLE